MRKSLTLLAAGLIAALAASNVAAGNLDKFLPSKVPGWKAGEIDEIGDHTMRVDRYYNANGEAQVSSYILRHRPNGLLGVPKLDGAFVGHDAEYNGDASFVTINGRKAHLLYSKAGRYGKVWMMGGKCSVNLDGQSVTEAQLLALAKAFDLQGLEAECK